MKINWYTVYKRTSRYGEAVHYLFSKKEIKADHTGDHIVSFQHNNKERILQPSSIQMVFRYLAKAARLSQEQYEPRFIYIPVIPAAK